MSTQSLNPNCRLLLKMNIYEATNVSKYPPEFVDISLFSERPLSMINRSIRGVFLGIVGGVYCSVCQIFTPDFFISSIPRRQM